MTDAPVAPTVCPHSYSGIGLVYCPPKLVQEPEQAEIQGYIYGTKCNHLSLCWQVLLLALCWCLPDPSLSQFNSLSLQKTKPATRCLACFHRSEFNQLREGSSECQGQSKERSRYVAPGREGGRNRGGQEGKEKEDLFLSALASSSAWVRGLSLQKQLLSFHAVLLPWLSPCRFR